MTDYRLSLLDDSLFSVETAAGESVGRTLPEVFTGLVAGNITSFEALQAHQKQPWHHFLVQVAAMAISREGDGSLPTTPDDWRELLVALADGEESAWCMVVDDIEKPAFFQPPAPEGSLDEAGYTQDIESPDELDILMLAKNHDIKRHRIRHPEPENWIYALLTLQTMEGYSGRSNYGIARMNGGYGNRPLLGVTPDLSWGTRFKRDVEVLLDHRDELTSERYRDDGIPLLWLEPWDGAKQSRIPLSECDPYFVEICRRIRFELDDDDRLVCWRNTTKNYRIDNVRELDGVTDDPWTPIDVSGPKALTVGESGFHYERIHDIWLAGQDSPFDQPAALQFREEEQDGGYLVATSLVRGQGKTQGLHQRRIPVPSEASRLFYGEESERQRLAKRATRRVATADYAQSDVLYPALRALLEAGQDRDVDYDDVQHWLDHYDSEIDDIFFDELWRSFEQEMTDHQADIAWQKMLFELAQDQLERAIGSAPIPSILKYRAISDAEGRFWNGAGEVFEDYLEDRFGDEDIDSTDEPALEVTDERR